MPNSRNVMANMKAFADLKRNPFDLKNGHTYSQKCGEIIPIKAVHTLPGDFMRGSITDQNISFPMNTAAFLSARKEITTYFVPYNHVFSLFNQLQATRPDPKTSALAVSDSQGLTEPRIYLYDLYNQCLSQFYWYLIFEYYIPHYVTWCYNDAFEENNRSDHYLQVAIDNVKDLVLNAPFAQAFTLNFEFSMYALSPLTQPATSVLTLSDFVPASAPISPWKPLTDRLPHALTTFRFPTSSVTVRDYVYDMEDRFRVYQYVRKLDMLGYGNLYPLFRAAEDSLITKIDNFGTSETVPALYFVDTYNYVLSNIIRMTTSNYDDVVRDNSEVYLCKAVNLYAILAYNKVFYDYFRNTYYDLKYSSRNYNIDFCVRDGIANTQLYCDMFDVRFLDIEYHQWKKDIVTGVLPNAQYGAVSGITIDTTNVELHRLNFSGTSSSDLGRWRTDEGSDVPLASNVRTGGTGSENRLVSDTTGNVSVLKHDHSFSGFVNGSAATLKAVDAFDVLQLKRAEMLQAYRQMLMRNGNRTIDIFKGLYGDAPASEDDNSPRFVDAFGSTLFVDTVVSTADTSVQNSVKGSLGDLGARSVINGGGKFTFKTSDFGVLLFLGYIVPDAVYPSLGLDPANRALDPESHFIPFFQNLGFQPVLAQDFNLYTGYQSDAETLHAVGFAPSYYDKKTDIDRAHGNFVSVPASSFLFGKSINDTQGGVTYHLPPFFSDFVGSFNHWIPQRNDVLLASALTLKHLYVNPSYWDNIFVQKVTSDYDSDHFVVNTRIYLHSVRKLSKLGLPNF